MQRSSSTCPRNQQRALMWLNTFVTLADLVDSIFCRRGIQTSVKPDYIVGLDMVQDIRTNLAWRQPPDAVETSHDETCAYCDGLSLGGGRQRLPSEEMLSVVHYKPTLADVDDFPATGAQLFWSFSWRKVNPAPRSKVTLWRQASPPVLGPTFWESPCYELLS